MRSFTQKHKIPIRTLTIFALLAAMMFISRFTMQGILNVHLLGTFIAAITLTYRSRALLPIYLYIFIEGFFAGFGLWWLPYLYIWLPLWGVFMLVGKINIPHKIKVPLYMILSALHGLSFGILYAFTQVFIFGFDFNATITWIIAGLPADVIHAISNFTSGILIIPLHLLLKGLNENIQKNNPH